MVLGGTVVVDEQDTHVRPRVHLHSDLNLLYQGGNDGGVYKLLQL